MVINGTSSVLFRSKSKFSVATWTWNTCAWPIHIHSHVSEPVLYQKAHSNMYDEDVFPLFVSVAGSQGLLAPVWQEQVGAAALSQWFPVRRWSLSYKQWGSPTSCQIHAEQRWKIRVCLCQSRVAERRFSSRSKIHPTCLFIQLSISFKHTAAGK